MSEPNWFLLYRTVGGVTEFAEVLMVESTVFRRTGRAQTWGTSTRIDSADANAAIQTAKLACEEFERDGFAPTRAWHFDPDAFDFELPAAEMLAATKSSFTALAATHSGLNAFAVATDSGAMTIFPLAHQFPFIADAKDEELWSPSEWTIDERGADFDITYRLILAQHRDELSRFEFLEYREGFARTAIAVLSQLKREGLFGSGEFVLLFDVTDSEGPDESLVSKLNSETLSARYSAWLAKWR